MKRKIKLSSFSPRRLISLCLIILMVVVGTKFVVLRAYAGILSTASIQLSDSRPSQSAVTYTTTFTFPGTTSIKCINIGFGSTAANVGTLSTTAPSSMVTTSAVKVSVTGGGLTDGNWTLYNSVNGIIQYQYTSGQASTATQVVITTSTITNTSSGTFYAQIATYSSVSSNVCSGLVDNTPVMALVTTTGLSVSATVDPTLTFSVADYGTAVNGSGTPGITTTSSTVPFGTVAAGGSALGSQTLTVSTNAGGGYTVYVRYTAAPSDGNGHTIADTAGSHTTPSAFSANSAFGYTVDEGTLTQFTSNTWAAFTTTNASVANATGPVSSDANHIAYKLGVGATQAPGLYTTTLTLTATPTY